MGLKCCVPNCRGNYNKKHKISVYGFPSNPDVRQKWIRAIGRGESYIPTKFSTVCRAHFTTEDFLTELRITAQSGQILTAPLPFPRLSKTAVPSIFRETPLPDLVTIKNKQKKIAVDTSDENKKVENYYVSCIFSDDPSNLFETTASNEEQTIKPAPTNEDSALVISQKNLTDTETKIQKFHFSCMLAKDNSNITKNGLNEDDSINSSTKKGSRIKRTKENDGTGQNELENVFLPCNEEISSNLPTTIEENSIDEPLVIEDSDIIYQENILSAEEFLKSLQNDPLNSDVKIDPFDSEIKTENLSEDEESEITEISQCFKYIKENVQKTVLKENWNLVIRQNDFLILNINMKKIPHQIFYIVVNCDLSVKIFVNGTPKKISGYNYVSSVNDIVKLLENFDELIANSKRRKRKRRS